MNDKIKKFIADSDEIELTFTVNVCCQNCNEMVAGSSINSLDEAKEDFAKNVDNENWHIGEVESEKYGAIFDCLCESCYEDAISEN